MCLSSEITRIIDDAEGTGTSHGLGNMPALLQSCLVLGVYTCSCVCGAVIYYHSMHIRERDPLLLN